MYQTNSARKGREKDFDLTFEEFLKIVKENCFYCGAVPREIRYRENAAYFHGIDRKDNSLGYVEGNMLTCCSRCNYLKGTMNFDQFMAAVKEISANQILSA